MDEMPIRFQIFAYTAKRASVWMGSQTLGQRHVKSVVVEINKKRTN